jgi:anti-anti-sigma factor
MTVDRESGMVILQPSGRIDDKTAQELQQKLTELLEASDRAVVVDLERTEHLGGAGIRLLLTLGKKLGGRGGGLVLCSMSEELKRSFSVAGVANQFVMTGSRQDALRQLAAAEKVARLSEEAAQLLAGADDKHSA